MNVEREVAALQRMTVNQLCGRYAEVYGERTNGRNKVWLVRRILWRLQARAAGGLSDRAKQRAAELADDADLRLNPPPPRPASATPGPLAVHGLRFPADDRLPPPGTILARKYKGAVLQVRVLPRGFEYEGEVYPSLSAVAKAITGSHCNGFHFFRLGKGGDS